MVEVDAGLEFWDVRLGGALIFLDMLYQNTNVSSRCCYLYRRGQFYKVVVHAQDCIIVKVRLLYVNQLVRNRFNKSLILKRFQLLVNGSRLFLI